jgi:hypothetical protein
MWLRCIICFTLARICCNNALYSLNNPSIIFFAQYIRILQNFKSSPLFKLIKYSSFFLKGESKWRINLVMVIGISTPLSPIYFSYIVISNFIGGGTENNQRMSLTNLYHFLNSNGYVRGLVFC